jgi:hypothetical protein
MNRSPVQADAPVDYHLVTRYPRLGRNGLGYGGTSSQSVSQSDTNCRGINISLTRAHGDDRRQRRSPTGIASPSESDAQAAPLRGGARSRRPHGRPGGRPRLCAHSAGSCARAYGVTRKRAGRGAAARAEAPPGFSFRARGIMQRGTVSCSSPCKHALCAESRIARVLDLFFPVQL